MFRLLTIASLISLTIGLNPAMAQAPAAVQAPAAAGGGRAARPPAPTRDPHTAGYVAASELADGANASPEEDGNFILGPTHSPAPEMTAQEGAPHGTINNFTMESADSKSYSGVARDPNPAGQTARPAGGPRVIGNHPAPYTRKVAVYVPKQYVAGTAAPFIVGADGPDPGLFTALDNLIAQHRLPVMIAISIGNGSGDGPGSERGLEYDTMSGKYAEFVETEVLPLVEKQCNVKLTKDPEGRATMGGSSGGSAAMAMAWFHPELYHRVLTYSGTYVNNQWPVNPELPHGAWELHEHLIPNSSVKPLRIWMEVGDRDNGGTGDVMHDWVVANENMAKVLAAKGYHYQFVFARNAGHTDRAVKQQTLPEALEFVWRGYPIAGQEAKPAAAAPSSEKPAFPSVLPGKGLAQHDFFYAGEAKSQDMYIVRNGKVVWEFHDPTGKGEISDAVLLSNGNVLFAHQFGVKLIDPGKTVLWHYDAPPGTEVHTAQPIGKDRILYVQNGDPAKVVVVNVVTGRNEREFVVPVRNPKSVHGHFRHARLTEAGTLLVAHMDMGRIAEYDSTGKELWSLTPGTATWSAERLKNGNTLITGAKLIREVNPAGATIWEFTPADVPDYLFNSMQIAKRLPNGNTLINTWVNQWNGPVNPATAPVQALEVTPDKKIVWALRAWGNPVDLGPSTTIQLLDVPGIPEAVHFGDLK